MSADEILVLFPTVLKYLLIVSAGLVILYFIRTEIRLSRNSRAPEFTEQATVYCKHPEKEMVYAGRGSHELFYVTFHTEGGQQLKLYMTYDQFYNMEEGQTGLLTWQGEKFWKFLPDDKEV